MPHASQAYLVIDASLAGPAPDEVAHLLRAGRIACVLLQPDAGVSLDQPRLARLVEAVQSQATAALIAGDTRLALALGADGVHLPAAAAAAADAEAAEAGLKAARALLGSGRIVGAGSGDSRHAAMVLAELGADYVAFGDTGGADAASRLALVGWWAEMFVVPCVAWGVADRQEARRMAEAGADFVAAGPAGGLAEAWDILAGLPLPQEANS